MTRIEAEHGSALAQEAEMALLCAAEAFRKDEPLHILHRPPAAAVSQMQLWKAGRSRQSAGHTLQQPSQHTLAWMIVQPPMEQFKGSSGNAELKCCLDFPFTRLC